MARTLAAEAPDWSRLPLREIASSGTDNRIFRLGDAQVVRVPRRPSAIPLLEKELDWLPKMRGLPLEVPALRYRGRIETDPPLGFGVFDWIAGRTATPDQVVNWEAAARAMAGFLKALHRVDTTGAPAAGHANGNRGVALEALSDVTLRAIEAVADEIDAGKARAMWDEALAAPSGGPGVWLHGDLKSDNLIVRDGALSGVIDWGLSAVGDPAADYATAWSWLDPAARPVLRDVLELGNPDWLRAKGWALYGAVIALSYYRGGRNEALCRQSRLTLARLGLL